MTSPLGDPIATPVAAAMLATILEEYDEREDVATPCEFGLASGATAVLDYCEAAGQRDGRACQGQLWVRVRDMYPSQSFPAIDQTVRPDGPTGWAVLLEIGFARRATGFQTPAGEIEAPTAEEETAATNLQLLDAHVIRQALLCRYPADNDDAGVLLENYVPFGPEGGCVGGAINCTVQVI